MLLIEAGRGRRLGAAGATGTPGRREQRPLGHGTQCLRHTALKCNTDENAGSLGFGTAGAAGTAPARCGGIGAYAGTASLPGQGRRRWPPPAASASHRVPGCGAGLEPCARPRHWVRHYDRALSAARPEGGRGREGRQTEDKRRERQRARARSASTRGARDRDGTKGALPRAGPQNKLEA